MGYRIYVCVINIIHESLEITINLLAYICNINTIPWNCYLFFFSMIGRTDLWPGKSQPTERTWT